MPTGHTALLQIHLLKRHKKPNPPFRVVHPANSPAHEHNAQLALRTCGQNAVVYINCTETVHCHRARVYGDEVVFAYVGNLVQRCIVRRSFEVFYG